MSPGLQFGTADESVGGSAGEPSSCSSVKVNGIRSPLRLGPNGDAQPNRQAGRQRQADPERDYDRLSLMALFSRKTKIDAAEFATSFYDRFVFGHDPSSGDFGQTFADSALRLIGEADSSFAAVSDSKLKEELRALRLEVIGTAWTHEAKAKAALAVSEATKEYLSSSGRLDLWEAMTDYNAAVAESATYGADPKSGTGRALLVLVNNGRMDLFDKWHEVRDVEAVARVANRFGSEASSKSGAMQGAVAVRVTHRLDIEGSDAVWERLAAIAHGFFQGAKEALDDVRLV